MKINTLKTILLMGFLSSLFGCGSGSSDKNSTSQISIPVENISATSDQQERRAKSEEICKSRNIPIYSNPNSLFVDSEAETQLRTKDEVVDRALALLYLGLKSEGLEKENLDKLDEVFGISSKLSPTEKEYATAANPTEQQQVNANWRYESLHVLLWSLGYIEQLVYPDQMCNVAHDVKIPYELGAAKFREQAVLRSKAEILDQADLILRFHWACVNARVNQEPAPGGLNPSIIYERHYSLNWLIKYMNQDWDDVSTDT